MFLVHSEDFTSGNSSDGVWNFNRSLKGNWTVIAQHIESQDIPWMWLGQDTIILRIHNPADTNQYEDIPVTFPDTIGFMTDTTEIMNAMIAVMQARIDDIALVTPYVERLVSGSVDEGNGNIVFIFDDDPVDIMWESEVEGFVSTFNPSVDKVGAENELNTSSWTMTYKEAYVDPKYLEVYIEQASSGYANSHDTTPTLLFSTRDGEFVNQQIYIPRDTFTLTIKIRRMGNNTNVVPLSKPWYLALLES